MCVSIVITSHRTWAHFGEIKSEPLWPGSVASTLPWLTHPLPELPVCWNLKKILVTRSIHGPCNDRRFQQLYWFTRKTLCTTIVLEPLFSAPPCYNIKHTWQIQELIKDVKKKITNEFKIEFHSIILWVSVNVYHYVAT